MQILNDPGPWWSGLGRELTVVDLMAAGTLPAHAAATLWWALEQGASILTAGGPSGAGKTTLANALLPFLPADARIYVHAGRDDPLALPTGAGPLYLLISELSDHGMPHYLSGPPALEAVAHLRDGTRLVGTMHADSVAEAVGSLRQEFGFPASDVARITLIAIMRITRGRIERGMRRDTADVDRRAVEIGLLTLAEDGVRVAPLTTWGAAGPLSPAPGATAALAAWADLPPAKVQAALDERAAILAGLLAADRRAPEDVAAAVQQRRAGRDLTRTR